MIAAASAQTHPPEPELQFDIGSTDDSLERMIELFARLGDTYRVFVPARGSYTYVIHHPDDVKRVLVSNHRNYTKGVGLDRVRILLGKGIMTSEGELWKRQRYMMQPFFHRRTVTEFAQRIAAVNERRLERWEQRARAGEIVNLTDEMSELTLEIVLRAIFGLDLDRLTDQLGANPFEVVTREPARDLQFAYKFRSLTKLVAQLIARRREEAAEHFDYLAMLMSARDQGHAEMEALPYTQQVINEALRLYPPGWLLSRRTIEADVLGGYPVPAGANVLLPLYLLHRHPGFWKDPEAFSPERFAPEHEGERPRFAYMPFAAGPRHCIGETLALYEMLVHLYKVARHYRLKWVPDKPLELEAQINLRTRFPLHMRLERRR